MEIINKNALLKEIRRIIAEELEKIIPKDQVNSLWKFLNQLNERLRALEQ